MTTHRILKRWIVDREVRITDNWISNSHWCLRTSTVKNMGQVLAWVRGGVCAAAGVSMGGGKWAEQFGQWGTRAAASVTPEKFEKVCEGWVSCDAGGPAAQAPNGDYVELSTRAIRAYVAEDYQRLVRESGEPLVSGTLDPVVFGDRSGCAMPVRR